MIDVNTINFNKSNGLVPAIIQDAKTMNVLMLGYMDLEAVRATLDTGKITFYSRSKARLWMKGEESGNVLHLVDIKLDCDQDALLIKANPAGPTCHKGTDTCWGEKNDLEGIGFLTSLEEVINSRKSEDPDSSYTASLFNKGINKIAQKVGEEAVELIIEAKDDNEDLFLGEAADLAYHFLVLLQAKGHSLSDIVRVLEGRHKPR